MGINVFPEPSSSGVNYNGGVEANRPADPAEGTTYFNTTTTAIEIYNGTAWQVIVQPSGLPTFNTASGSLGNVNEQTALTGQFTISATDPEGGAITYSVKDATPNWLSIGSSSGVLSGTTPSVTTDTVVSFTIRATDAFGFFADRAFSIEVKDAIFVEYVILAGGGGGGGGEGNSAGDGGGGGGGGGYITGNTTVDKVTHTVVVGAGGAGQPGAPAGGGSGDNGVLSRIHVGGTTIAGLTVNGGGGGGGNDGQGQDGGCGGGDSGDASGAGGAGNPGFAGGSAGGGARSGGGGGGMSAVGTAVSGGGSGGAGVTDPIKSIAVGGGGAGGRGANQTQVGVGATAFGGGNDSANGTANTGGGGGAGQSGSNAGGNGGSGRIIIKTLSQASATTGSPTATTSGSYYIYDYTASGSITWSQE